LRDIPRRFVMDSTFVRRDFYIQPPDENATPEEWQRWLKKDNRKAAAHKAAYTRSLVQQEAPEEYQGTAMRKVDGVWKQVPAMGFVGDAEQGGAQAQPIVEEMQEQVAILKRMGVHLHKPTTKSKGKSARRRRNKRGRK